MNQHLAQLRDRLRGLELEKPPPPWHDVATFKVGGLLAAGCLSPDGVNEYVLVLSSSGRGVFDAASGEKLARDSDVTGDGLDEVGLTVDGIGPLAGHRVPLAGIWGGGLTRVTQDRWSIELVAPDWPYELVVLTPPGRSVMTERLAAGCVAIDKPITDIRAAGFTRSGRTLIIATASDLRLIGRLQVVGAESGLEGAAAG